MTIARLIMAGLVLFLAAYIAAMNWGCVVASLRNQKKGIDKHHSTVPLVTVLLAGIVCPIRGLLKKSETCRAARWRKSEILNSKPEMRNPILSLRRPPGQWRTGSIWYLCAICFSASRKERRRDCLAKTQSPQRIKGCLTQ